MKKLLSIFILIFMGQIAFAFDIVYPKKENVLINSPTTFFIGHSDNPIYINEQSVELHKTGAFAYFVKLQEGTNIFEIKSGDCSKIYKITSNSGLITKEPDKFTKYSCLKYYSVKIPNTPLRSSPINDGINRISHLQENILLTIDGEMANFYRVVLGEDKYAWILKSTVTPTDKYENAIISGFEITEENNFIKIIFHLDKRVPYEIIENDDIGVKFYNTTDNYSYEFPYKKEFGTNKIFGYNGEYNNNNFVLKIRKYPNFDTNQILKGINITIDAGHGGIENGAIGCLGDKEKDVNLQIAKYLEHMLKKQGANVFMTRTSDKTISLSERIDIANSNDSMIFISIHNNALPDTLDPNKHRGTSVYYFYDEAKLLGANILNSIINDTDMPNDNLHQKSFAVLRNSSALSVLVEVGYLINPTDNELIINKQFQKSVAKAIAKGIKNYLMQ